MRSSCIVLVSAFVALRAGRARADARRTAKTAATASQPVPDGMLRLDTRTGAVSLCAKKDAGWACNTVPDERAGAGERDRAAAARERRAEEGHAGARPAAAGRRRERAVRRGQRELNLKVPLPSDAEIDRVMSAFEKMWRRLVDMMQKTPGSDRI